ncbi:MAG: hypothetical protein VYB54_17710 [Pseudomonadota bacterium]|nr:hypothetical protein [Pseudomonadota bacterium]
MALTGVLCGIRREGRPLLEAAARAGQPVDIRYSGAIAANARAAAHALVAAGATRLLSFGVAGALSDSLKPGDLVIPRLIRTTDDEELHTDAAWHAAVLDLAGATTTDAMLGVDHAATSLGQKAFLGAAYDAVALDMESHFLARAAREAGVPFLAVRAVADGRRTLLPRAALVGVGPDGHERPHRVALSLMQRPNEYLAIWRLARASAAAFRTLGRVGGLPALLAGGGV